MTTELTKAAQQALEALDEIHAGKRHPQLALAVAHNLRRALTQRPAAQAEREAFARAAPIPTPAPPFATYDEHGNGCDDEIQDFYYRHCQDVETRAFNRGYDAASLPAPQQATPAQDAENAGLVSANGHLSMLLNESTQMLAQLREMVDALHDTWSNGGRPERGEFPLLDRVDDWLNARPPEMLTPQQATPDPEWETSPKDGEQWETTPKQATPEPVGEPLQGGLDNDALLNAWRSKLPGVTPTDAQMTAFALGVEVGFAHARKLERSDWSRVHDVLKKAGVHPGRTDDHLADVIAKALANRPAPGVPDGWRIFRTHDGIDVHTPDGGACYVEAKATADRRIPEEVLHALCCNLLAAAQAKGADK